MPCRQPSTSRRWSCWSRWPKPASKRDIAEHPPGPDPQRRCRRLHHHRRALQHPHCVQIGERRALEAPGGVRVLGRVLPGRAARCRAERSSSWPCGSTSPATGSTMEPQSLRLNPRQQLWRSGRENVAGDRLPPSAHQPEPPHVDRLNSPFGSAISRHATWTASFSLAGTFSGNETTRCRSRAVATRARVSIRFRAPPPSSSREITDWVYPSARPVRVG